MQGWKGPEGLRREAGEPTVLDDVPADPAPGPRAGPDELVCDGVEDRDLALRQGDDREPDGQPAGGVPDPDGAVVAAGEQAGAVGGPGHRPHPVGVAGQRAQRRDIPRCLPTAAGQRAISSPGASPSRSVVAFCVKLGS
jgi:hypothetical protein